MTSASAFCGGDSAKSVRHRHQPVFADERERARQPRRFETIAADHRQQRQLLECPLEVGDGLAFQRARNWRRLFWCLFRIEWQVGRQPLDDAALERNRSVALPDQTGRDMRCSQLVGIRVIHHDVAVTRQRRRRTPFGDANRARQCRRAVLVGVLETRVDNHRWTAAVEFLFEIFFADAGNRHGGIVIAPRKDCQTAVPRRTARAGYWASARLNGRTRDGCGAALMAATGLMGAVICVLWSTDQPADRFPLNTAQKIAPPGRTLP